MTDDGDHHRLNTKQDPADTKLPVNHSTDPQPQTPSPKAFLS